MKQELESFLQACGVKPSGNIFQDIISLQQEDVDDFVLSTVFKMYDSDKNGYIDKQEFLAAFKDILAAYSIDFAKFDMSIFLIFCNTNFFKTY